MTIPYDEPPPDSEPRYSYRRNGGGKFDGAIKAIGISVITALIIAFIMHQFAVDGSIANLRESAAVLTTSQKFLQEQVTELKQENREHRKDMRELSGKNNRGVDEYENADQRKP